MAFELMKRFRWSLVILAINCFFIGTQMSVGHALLTTLTMVAWVHRRDLEKENLSNK
jgi:hypothetical protein